MKILGREINIMKGGSIDDSFFSKFSAVTFPWLKKEKEFVQYKRTDTELEKCWNVYISNPIVFGGINTIALKCLSNGFEIKSEDEGLKVYIEERLDVLDLQSMLFYMIQNALIFGDSITELSLKGNIINGLKQLNPVKWDGELNSRTGEITHTYNEKQIKAEKIIHFNFFPIPEKTYGIPLIKAVIDQAESATSIDESIREAINRHGTTKWHIKILPDRNNRYPSKEVMEEFSADLADLKTQQTLITTDRFEVEGLDTQGVPNIQNYNEYLSNLISTGLGVPIEALGQASRGSTFATAKVRMDMFLASISFYQEIVSDVITTQLVSRIADSYLGGEGESKSNINVKFIINPVFEDDRAKKAEWMAKLAPYGILTSNEMRELLGYEVSEEIPEEVIEEEEIESKSFDLISKPYPNEFSCRVNDPSKYDKFRRVNGAQTLRGRRVDVIYGIKAGTSEIQSYRLPTTSWDSTHARNFCRQRSGLFEDISKSSVEKKEINIDRDGYRPDEIYESDFGAFDKKWEKAKTDILGEVEEYLEEKIE